MVQKKPLYESRILVNRYASQDYKQLTRAIRIVEQLPVVHVLQNFTANINANKSKAVLNTQIENIYSTFLD
jgi:hypothetical protein